MTDRKLLEKAAKAAGMPHPKWNEVHNYMMVGLGGDTKEWNPLTDDGDAMRLAVKLSMRIDIGQYQVVVTWTDFDISEDHPIVEYFDAQEEASAEATRRAIVRAAASRSSSWRVKMEIKIRKLKSGYWYARLDGQRFAQWPVGENLTLANCFDPGWWTQAEVDQINLLVGENHEPS